MIAASIDIVGAIYEMLRAALICRFRFHNPYWTWRRHTAFPDGKPPNGRGSTMRLIFEYFIWVRRIRRLR